MSKKEDLTRRRNAELSAELERVKAEYAVLQNADSSTRDRMNELIADLEAIKEVWLQALDEVQSQRDEYAALLDEMREFKKTVKGRNAIERWFFDLKK